MIAIDTNVLVRLMVRDDEPQAARAVAALERAQVAGEPCFISLPVVCETVWVLTRSYGVRRAAIAAAIGALLEDPLFEVDRKEIVAEALERYRSRRAGLVDYVVAALGRRQGARATFTFDRGLRRDPDFTLL